MQIAYSESTSDADAEIIREWAEVMSHITTSFGFMNLRVRLERTIPSIVFMHCSGYKTAENVGTHFGRRYQVCYLTGLIAGAMTETNKTVRRCTSDC